MGRRSASYPSLSLGTITTPAQLNTYMESIAVQKLRVGIDRAVDTAATHHTLAGSLQLTICQEHRREGGGGQDAAVGLHLRLLELQQAVSMRMVLVVTKQRGEKIHNFLYSLKN